MPVTRFPIGVPADVNLNDVRSRAKALLRSAHAGESIALERVKPYFEDPSSLTLQRAQLVIAREHGFSSWRKLKAFVDARDALADCQRKQASLPFPKERADFRRDSEWQRGARELRRLTCVIAEMFDATVDDTDTACCTFCFEPHDGTKKLIAGIANFICQRCVDQCVSLMKSPGTSADDDRDYLPCSFCKKPATQAESIVTASNSSICNECLEICLQIVAGDPPPR
ncbi:MAG: hypothetical protein F4089_14440 [Gammaproteobacteria bacterium]|nr:hypothetical protein [Gammaproteobacteria bacterium]